LLILSKTRIQDRVTISCLVSAPRSAILSQERSK
jgi:hypothetical protein